MKDFSFKFIDIMVGVILGLGFQWWPNLTHPWQYIAFAFVYLDIVDYWIDYAPSLKKFPPRRELDLMIDVAIMFALFFYIYAVQLGIMYLLFAFSLLRFFDFLWLLRARGQYHPTGFENAFVRAYLLADAVEVLVALAFIAFIGIKAVPVLATLIAFIAFRILARIWASFQYKRVYFA